MRTAIYLRVSTDLQTVQNQRQDITTYVQARGWTTTKEYADEGISGTKERRPALDALLHDARRRRFDVLVVWSLDRIGRNLRHLLTTLEDLQLLGIAVVSLRDGLDLSTAAGRLQMAVIGAIAQFERDRLRERTIAGLARARAQGKRLGRRRTHQAPVPIGLTVREAARQWGVSKSTAARRLATGQTPSVSMEVSP